MIPGGAHPFLRAGGGHWKSHYKIGHSVRLCNSANGSFSRTPLVAGNRKVFTVAGWLRGADCTILAAGDGTNANWTTFSIAGGRLTTQHIAGYSTIVDKQSTRLLRDPINHYFYLFSYENGTIRAFIFDEEITSWASNINTLGAANTFINHTNLHTIGRVPYSTNPGDVYVSQPVVIDGLALLPSDFIRRCPEKGHWEPIKHSVTYGAQGSFLDFSDGSAATSAALGKDRSGNNNDWTPNSISVAAGVNCDWLLDTPTNRFATLNPLRNSNSSGTAYSYGNLNATTDGVSSVGSMRATIALPTAGRIFCELKATDFVCSPTGVGAGFYGLFSEKNSSNYLVIQTLSDHSSALTSSRITLDGVNQGAIGTLPASSVIGIAADCDLNFVEFFVNDVSVWSGSYPVNTGDIFIGFNGDVGEAARGSATEFNFGQRPFTYTPPAGFKALCAANEPEPAVVKSGSAIVMATDTGANIQATLAAKRAGWAGYIEIFKSLGAEGWRFRFSDDLANHLDTSTTNAKAAFPALGGVSYVGYAMRVSALNGVATGTFAHVNGVADTITDGLGTARKAVILKRESVGGGDFFFYHPDLTAGKLLYLNLTSGETTDATIGSVTANSFITAAALPSGTYRWIGLAEVAGFLSLFIDTGNGSTDGPFDYSGLSPALMYRKDISAAGHHYCYDAASANTLEFNLPNSGSAGSFADPVATGSKVRVAGGDRNTTGNKYIGINIAAFPSRYANAR